MVASRRTRGKTRPGRLGKLDGFIVRSERGLLAETQGVWAEASVVDLGFGEFPVTTLELAAAVRRLNPGLRVVGVEREPRRVAMAQGMAEGLTSFLEGGFELPGEVGAARLIRAMNVLRQYRPEEVEAAHEAMAARLVEGGLLVEGTCSKRGEVLVAHLLRKTGEGVAREGMVFMTDFSRGFAPIMFRDQLPRDLRRRVVPGEEIHRFFEAWEASWEEARRDRPGAGLVETFERAGDGLGACLEGVCREPWALGSGVLWWRPPRGVPRADVGSG